LFQEEYKKLWAKTKFGFQFAYDNYIDKVSYFPLNFQCCAADELFFIGIRYYLTKCNSTFQGWNKKNEKNEMQ
jgi:hypothetical protein